MVHFGDDAVEVDDLAVGQVHADDHVEAEGDSEWCEDGFGHFHVET